MAGYVAYSTENKFGPLTIKHLPMPMIVDIASYSITQSFGHAKSYWAGLYAAATQEMRYEIKDSLVGLSLLYSKICSLCFLAFPQLSAYYAHFYAFQVCIMLTIYSVHFYIMIIIIIKYRKLRHEPVSPALQLHETCKL